tara:strand:+ start:1524 stop:2174 length:651 start_codon:yes stop_codon:yes gene_type:complete
MELNRKVIAARALLDWSQKDLEKESGISLGTISKFESGVSSSLQRGTERAIKDSFMRYGIEIVEGGVREVTTVTRTYKGDPITIYLQLLSEVHTELSKEENKALLIMYADDAKSPDLVDKKYLSLRSDGIQMRQLVCEGSTCIKGSLEEYRLIPKKYFTNVVTLIFGDFVATVAGDGKKILVIKDPLIAHRDKNTFEYLWEIGQKPTSSTAEVRYV